MSWYIVFLVQETNSDVKVSEISATLSVPVQLLCNCSLSMQRRFFSCLNTMDSQTVAFLAELSYTAYPSVDMPFLLTSWVASTPHIIVASTQLQVDSTCPVVINSLEPKLCPIASATPPAGPSTHTSTDASTDLSTGTEVAIVAGAVCASVLILVIITVAIVIAVVVFCRKQSKCRYIYMPHNTTLIMYV